MAKSKFYVVWKGKKTGVFTNWNDCKAQIDGVKGAQYKSFENYESAKEAFSIGYANFKAKSSTTPKNVGKPIIPSLSVDAACSGNPGRMEYRGVDTKTKKQIFIQGPFEDGTNNVGEFLALVHGLAFLKSKNSKLPLYTDSKIAMGWIKTKHCKTTLKRTARNIHLFELIERAENWLKNNTFSTQIIKWETKVWGEIPADFGRK
ncbi:viroplasmin family protein [Aureivirga sp. CE67]|uniref:ribonuclease H1 domain-containing protein n=1 Tax=Aureivirga sp. CE67 TaxID=1788983 RepID=UPI0018CBDA85|nr:ribonuclease H family protein [Aureivirga sp. CE67]